MGRLYVIVLQAGADSIEMCTYRYSLHHIPNVGEMQQKKQFKVKAVRKLLLICGRNKRVDAKTWLK